MDIILRNRAVKAYTGNLCEYPLLQNSFLSPLKIAVIPLSGKMQNIKIKTGQRERENKEKKHTLNSAYYQPWTHLFHKNIQLNVQTPNK